MKNIAKLKQLRTKAGYPMGSDVGSPGSPGKRTPESDEVRKAQNENAEIAAFHEYGLGVPLRPTFGPAFDKNKGKIIILLKREYNKIVDGKTTAEKGIGRVGVFMADRIKKEILQLRKPPNSQETIDRKGSSKPLIDTGQMTNSVTSIVTTEEVRKGTK